MQWGPKEPPPLDLAGPSENTDERLQWVLRLDSNRLHFAPNNPCLDWALKLGQSLGPSLVSWREEAGEDVALLREELQAEQEERLQSAPEHVRRVYRQGGEHFVLQPLAFLRCLSSQVPQPLQTRLLGSGPLLQGTNWEVRQDAKYSRPLTRSQFEALNSAHKRSLRKPSEHSGTMLQEIGKEQQRDRFQGPFDPAQVASRDGKSFAGSPTRQNQTGRRLEKIPS